MTPLAEKLATLIRANGPITIADYMAACLGDLEYGYYMQREPFGRGGDFITAPEVSQMFGELIGAWAVATWQAMGSPSPFILGELGPGRGTLMKDLLRAARVRPAFGSAAGIHLVETSPRLREIQRSALDDTPVTWHANIADIPPGPAIFIANEFFDALPIRQFLRTPQGWGERMIGLGDDGQLAFGQRPMAGQYPLQAADAVMETSPAAVATVAELAGRLARQSGAALIIDYGYEGPASGDTLQAIRGHRPADLLAAPGEADITAHVDFGALARAATKSDAVARPLVPQGEFLRRLGLRERAERLKRGKEAETATDIDAAVERLAGPKAMGELFKVLALSSQGLALPAFEDNSRS